MLPIRRFERAAVFVSSHLFLRIQSTDAVRARPNLNWHIIKELPGALYSFLVGIAGNDLRRAADMALAVHFVNAVFVPGSVPRSEGN